ncbi:efflux RND transporter periplasmic adaptor subunit [Lysobacter cavernae]|uniref:Efflux RND transporter periplasmic adaptor subunit n=1 Tax=Lysobacter cavernae TaxID=1685901 RepID=A0ABV7RL22_9GAMM
MAKHDPYSLQRAPSTRKRMIWMLLITGLVFGGVFAVKAFFASQTNQFFDNMPQPPVAVSAYTAQQESWSDAQEAVGTLVAVNGTEVTTESGGVVKAIAFDAGQPVKAGTLLVQLNSANELATLKSLEASAKLAAVQADRWRKLATDKLVSVDEAQQRATAAATAQAQVEAQRALIAQKTVRAPFDGVLGIRKVNLGQYLNPGDPIVSLQSLDPIYLNFTLPEQRMSQTHEGTAIRATVDALPGQAFEGRITAIDPNVDASTRNFAVQATLRNPKRDLRPGTFARVDFESGQARRVVVIPQTAVSFNPYGNAVYVISEKAAAPGAQGADGKPAGPTLSVQQRFIKTGTTRGDLVAVTDGLKPGERVVTSGLLKLRNDAQITINNKVEPTAQARPTPENR